MFQCLNITFSTVITMWDVYAPLGMNGKSSKIGTAGNELIIALHFLLTMCCEHIDNQDFRFTYILPHDIRIYVELIERCRLFAMRNPLAEIECTDQ